MTGQAIVKAILAGERNPRKLAEFRNKKSLTSHIFLPRQESLLQNLQNQSRLNASDCALTPEPSVKLPIGRAKMTVYSRVLL